MIMAERNPSPPREFEDEADKFRQDMIGDTTISRRWVYSTLMDMCKEAEMHTKSETEDTVDVSEELQDEMCRLWDLCVEEDVACFLANSGNIPLLSGVIASSKSPRLTEITVGILGNMACTSKACEIMCKDSELSSTVISLLSCRDSPTLAEVGRLINTCLSDVNSKELWLDFMESNLPNFLDDISFILNSSTNSSVLKNISEMIDVCLDSRDDLLLRCVEEEFVNSVAESGLQLIKDDNSFMAVVTSLHILYLLTTLEEKAIGVFKSNSKVLDLATRCCEKWKNLDDFNIAEDNPPAVPLASCLSVVDFVLDVSLFEKDSTFLENVSKSDRKSIVAVTELVQKYCDSTSSASVQTKDSADRIENASLGTSGKDVVEVNPEKSHQSISSESNAKVGNDSSNHGNNGILQELFPGVPLSDIVNSLSNTLIKLKWMNSI